MYGVWSEISTIMIEFKLFDKSDSVRYMPDKNYSDRRNICMSLQRIPGDRARLLHTKIMCAFKQPLSSPYEYR